VSKPTAAARSTAAISVACSDVNQRRRFARVGEVFGDDARLGPVEDDQISGRKQQTVGGVRGVQVVVEQTMRGGAALRVCILRAGLVGGVDA